MLEHIISFTLSFLIGLLIGVERERSHPSGMQAIGVRTFILIALLGTTATLSRHIAIMTAISLFTLSMIALSYYRSTEKKQKYVDIGITTELSAAIVFILGMTLPIYPFTAITISAVVLLVLMERKRLHGFSRQSLKPAELEALILLIIFVVGILPILPNRTIDPWQLINPRTLGILFAVLAGMQFSGYLIIRLFGNRLGRALLGFLGGLVSSTAVYATMPELLRDEEYTLSTMASGILAITAILAEITVIICLASKTLIVGLVTPIASMMVASLLISFFLLVKEKPQKESSPKLIPLKLTTIFKSTVLIASVLLLVAILKMIVSDKWLYVIAFLTGLFELHGITLASSILHAQQKISLVYAEHLIAIALLASFISKFFILWSLTPKTYALQLSIWLLAILSVGGITFLVF